MRNKAVKYRIVKKTLQMEWWNTIALRPIAKSLKIFYMEKPFDKCTHLAVLEHKSLKNRRQFKLLIPD
jgi:hypothetical protein